MRPFLFLTCLVHSLGPPILPNRSKYDISFFLFAQPNKDGHYTYYICISIYSQGRRKAWKSGGACKTVVGIICLPGWDRVNCFAKNWGGGEAPPLRRPLLALTLSRVTLALQTCGLSIDPTLGSTFLYCLFYLKKMQHQILSFFKSRNPDWKDKTWYFCLIPIIVLHYGQFLLVLFKNSLILKDTRNCFTI